MTIDRRRVRELFELALDRDEREARSWIAAAAADDPAVRDEVLSLFDHHTRAGAFLIDPIAETVPELLADEEPLAPGAVVGAYTVVRELGRGGMGRVYLASDARLGRQVALKALAPHLLRDPRQRERLRREARAAAALTHPGICTVYALEEIDGELYIATEFVDGRTLRDEIGTGIRPARAQVFRTAREIASALAAAHVAGVVHRDLKPENVMRTADGRLKILDFGLARIEDAAGEPAGEPHNLSRAGMILGTPGYMSPEQITGQPVDARADVFAFGVLMYEYACGVHPFEAGTTFATVARVLDSDVAPLTTRAPDVGAALAEVIDRCVRKAPADRFASGVELSEALGRAAEQRDGQPSRDRSARWWRTHQFAIVALYVAASTMGWQIKTWVAGQVPLSIFLALGAASTIGGVLRGHLLFTERVNRSRLAAELRRTAGALRGNDSVIALLLLADGLTVAGRSALTAAIVLGLGLGLAAAAYVLEPSTTTAAFGETDDDRDRNQPPGRS